MTTSLLQGKPFYCREWVFTKLSHCLESRPTAKTCGALMMGGPGSGKTAVCCELVWPTGSSRATSLNQRLLAYYFCQAHDVETLSLGNFVLGIIEQVASSKLISGFNGSVEAGLCHRDPVAAFRDHLLTPLQSIPAPSQNLFILVDSVDESYLQATSNGPSSTALPAVSTIAELLACNHLHCPPWLLIVCTARRQSRSVTRQFAGFRKVVLDDLRKAHVVRDVQQYILCRLDRDDRLRLHLSRETAELLNQLHIKCNGCFLYLERVLDGVVDKFILLREIREIPGTLNGLYLWLSQRLFIGRQFSVVQPVLNIILAARRPLTELELYSCALTRCTSLTFAEFRRRIDVLSKVLVEGCDGTRILFHHSFAEWLLDVKHCTPRFLCSPSEGHAMLALSFTAHASELSACELHNFALHVARCGLFTQSFYAAQWIAQSGAHIEDCLNGVNVPADPAVVRLLISAGATPPSNETWIGNEAATSEHLFDTGKVATEADVAELDTERHALSTLAASPSAVSIVSESPDASLANQTALALAARRGDLDTVNAVLAAGTDVDSTDADGWTALRSASWSGHTAVVSALLTAGAAVDRTDADGRTALRAAAWGGHYDIVDMLLSAGANVDGTDSEGRTALIAAAYMGHYAVVGRLIAAGADVNRADTDGRTALAVTALGPRDSDENRVKVVTLLIDSAAEVDHRDRDMMTPLLVAAYEGRSDLSELLLDAGADVDAADVAGRTALQAAVASGAPSVVALLLFWGAAIDVIDAEGRTVLGTAAQMGDAGIVRQLLDRGLDELHRDNAGWTALHVAAFEGHNEVVEALLEAGARVTEVDNDGRVPLILAAQEGHLSVVRSLVQTGTPVESRGHDGRTPLRAAASAGDNGCEVVRYLVECGASINTIDADGRTALYALAVDGHVDTALLLLNAGADANIADTEGRSPLHAAAWHGHRDFVMALLDRGGLEADVCDIEGRTPLHSAAWQGHSSVVALLVERGARVNHVCSQGATALCVAAQEGHEGVVRMLLRAGADASRADRCGRTPARVAARGGHVGIVRLLKEHASGNSISTHNGCTATRQTNQNSNSSLESGVDGRRIVAPPTNSMSTNQSSSSSGAGGECHSLTFTQQLQQCSDWRQGLSPVREPPVGASSAVTGSSAYHAPRNRGSSDELIIEPIWQRRSETRRPGAMVMGKTALTMNSSPESRQVKQKTNSAIITNPGYSPTTPDVTLCTSSRGIYANPNQSESSDDGTTNNKPKMASRPSGLALKRETPL